MAAEEFELAAYRDSYDERISNRHVKPSRGLLPGVLLAVGLTLLVSGCCGVLLLSR